MFCFFFYTFNVFYCIVGVYIFHDLKLMKQEDVFPSRSFAFGMTVGMTVAAVMIWAAVRINLTSCVARPSTIAWFARFGELRRGQQALLLWVSKRLRSESSRLAIFVTHHLGSRWCHWMSMSIDFFIWQVASKWKCLSLMLELLLQGSRMNLSDFDSTQGSTPRLSYFVAEKATTRTSVVSTLVHVTQVCMCCS